MERYANLNGNSGVDAYEIGSDRIVVSFDSGSVYEYTYSSAGRSNIEAMKSLAQAGRGLCSFIQRTVRKNYNRKLR